MGFTWTQDISPGASIDAADINEIREKTDTLYDNMCSSHDSSYNTTYYPSNLDNDLAPVNSGAETGVDNSYYFEDWGTYWTGVDTEHNPGDDSTYFIGAKTSHFTGDKGIYYASYKTGDDGNVLSADYDTYHNDDHDVHFSSVNSGAYSDNDVGEDVGYDSGVLSSNYSGDKGIHYVTYYSNDHGTYFDYDDYTVF